MANKIRLVLVDIDNTVYDYAPCHRDGLAAAQPVSAKVSGRWKKSDVFLADYDAARGVVQKEIGGTAASHSRFLYFKGMLEKTGLGETLAPALELEDAYWRGYFATMKADPACRPTLEAFRAAKIPIAWLSNFTARRQGEKLLALGLDGLATLHTSEDTGFEKPHRSLFDRALKAAGAKANETLVIGDDRENDVAPAQKLGMQVLWIDRENDVAPPGIQRCRNWTEVKEKVREWLGR